MKVLIGTILCCVIALNAALPFDFEDYYLKELVKRHSRSSDINSNINSFEWQQQQRQNEIRNDENEVDAKNDLQKKILPYEMLKKRLEMKEQAIKRNSASNANYYMQLCHFKICNMGKRRSSRYWQ